MANAILVVGEVAEGALAPIAAQMLGGARKLAGDSGGSVACVVMGAGVEAIAQEAIACGADEVYRVVDAALAEYNSDSYALAMAHELSGVLTLRSPDGATDVFFRDGQLVFARDASTRETLGEELVRRGLVERADSEAAARERERRRDGPRIGAILVSRGKIRREDLERLVRERIKDAICRVVEWREGRFTFESGVEPEEEDILLDVQLESLLLECLTRLDDARRGRVHGSGE